MRILWNGIILVVLVVLAWRISALGVSAIYLDAIGNGEEDAPSKALDWNPGEPQALLMLGVAKLADDRDAARDLVTRAYLAKPTDYRPLLVLAGIALADGDRVLADRFVQQAAALGPVDPTLQEQIARYWLEQSRPDLALAHFSTALGARESGSTFMVLRKLIEDPAASEAFNTLALNPPRWWMAFFEDVASGANLETLRRLYGMRRQPGAVPMTLRERQTYVRRLLRDEQFEEAYLAWVNSLNAQQRQQLGLLHNGNFELPLSGFGFDWHLSGVDRVDVARSKFDIIDEYALRLTFRLSKLPFDHLYQPLFLAPGYYAVSGVYRSVDLLTDAGFRWDVRCVVPEQRLLGESSRIFGAEQWSEFSFELEVPAGCLYQEIRLQSGSAQSLETATDGELWFDRMAIRRIEEMSPLERAKAEARQLDDVPE
jgi:hypothetical protein